LRDDHFRMGNYVAVHRTCVPLIVALNLNPKVKPMESRRNLDQSSLS